MLGGLVLLFLGLWLWFVSWKYLRKKEEKKEVKKNG